MSLMLWALTTMSVSVFQPFMATIQPDSRFLQLGMLANVCVCAGKEAG